MNEEWLVDGRKIPDEVMGYIRKIAVQAVRENGQSPEVVAKVLNFNRSCIYDWLRRYDQGGYEALESGKPPGAKPLITREMEVWLEETVLSSTPVEHGYDTNLWTRDILAEMLKKEFGVSVSGLSVSLHLRKRGLSYQKPSYRDLARDEREVEHFVNDTFPRIQRLAGKMGADIGFEDEAGIGLMKRSGRKHAGGSGGYAARWLQCPVDCHTQGRDELFGDGRVGEFGTVHRVFRRPDPPAAASIDLNRRPGPVSWLSEAPGMGSSASDSAENLLFA
jgi:transposase